MSTVGSYRVGVGEKHPRVGLENDVNGRLRLDEAARDPQLGSIRFTRIAGEAICEGVRSLVGIWAAAGRLARSARAPRRAGSVRCTIILRAILSWDVLGWFLRHDREAL